MRRKFPIRHALISALMDLDMKGFRWIAHRLPGFLIPKPTGPGIMRTLYGFWLQLDPVRDEGIERTIYYTGTYEKGTLAILKELLRPGDIFVDVGANIGLMSIFASRIVGEEGRVYAFEPNPETTRILRENIELNHCSNIKVSEYAIGKSPGKARIYDSWESNRGSATLVQPERMTESHEVQVTTLSEYFLSGGDNPGEIRVVKLDIEGFELEALQGAGEILIAHDSPILVVECSDTRENSRGGGTQQLFEFISRLERYRIFTGRNDKSRVSRLTEVMEHGDLREHDNIYCFTSTQLSALPKRLFKPMLKAH